MTVLAFDTSGPFCSAALFHDGRVVSEAYADMARGQAEALMPMIANLMTEAGIGRRHLTAIAVGTGPGNFTGLRIAVAAARGFALGLGIPAIGVSAFEVLIAQAGNPTERCLWSLPAPRDQVYLHLSEHAALTGSGWLAAPDDPGRKAPHVLGAQAETLARAMGGAQAQHAELPRPAPVIATLAAERVTRLQSRPVPLYIRAADAAPSRHQPPPRLP